MRFPGERLGSRLRARLRNAQVRPASHRIDFARLDGLPDPVHRYLRRVLPDGGPVIASVHLVQRGEIDLGRTAPDWRPCVSDQLTVVESPGFHWEARVRMRRFLPVRVHDAYVDGEGILVARLLGLVPIASLHDHGELARAELMRFLAEAPWYPTALMPRPGLRGTAIDDRNAEATLESGDHRVALRFCFDAAGLITSVEASSRAQMIGGRLERAPWRGVFGDYFEREEMLVPRSAEVSWGMAKGPRPYWRGTLEQISFQWSR